MPQVPAVPGTAALNTGAAGDASLADRVAWVFEPGGPLASSVPDFEPRQAQRAMAAAVARAIERGGVLLVEAGTGIGKTIAYLVPAILSRQRVLISTGTKNLQEQIYFKDIPALRDALGVPFTATYMKGRANYLCLHRLDQLRDDAGRSADEDDRFRSAGGDVFLPIIRDWAGRTETGDRAELEELPEELPFWTEVSATAERCLGGECPRYDDCFVTRMRQRAAASDIVIVNHHLLCADASVRLNAYGEVIPACSQAVIDEAHQLEEVATQYFGMSVSNYRLEDLAGDIERVVVASPPADSGGRSIAMAVRRLREDARAFFSEVALAHRTTRREFTRKGSEERIRATAESLSSLGDSAGDLIGALDLVESALPVSDQTAAPTEEESPVDARDERLALASRAREIRDELRFLLKADDAEYVYFVELRGKGVFLRAAPIDVSRIIRDLLVDRMRTTVLTSATLAVDGSFEYIRDRLGIAHADELRLASEFDFTRQAILYLPRRMPDPRSPSFTAAAGREVIELLKCTEGRAFVLFTSYAALRAVQALAELALDYPTLVQGTAPRSQLLKQFRETPHAVLFATSSFWQGVDVMGDALSCVIIDKLPFASPADPITAARIDALRARGGEPFEDYQVPVAILALQQGLGRLIRHRHDRGLLAVLDPRLRTKGYGPRFIASLPPAPVVDNLAAVQAFFSME